MDSTPRPPKVSNTTTVHLGELRPRLVAAAAAAGVGPSTWLRDLVRRELDGYFAGETRAFTLPHDLSGLGAFHRAVLEALYRSTGFGEVTTYGALAREVGKPGGARAVGQAVGRNPIAIVIPCHRVFASSGLGGYAGGLPIKRALLAIEGHPPAVVQQRGYVMR